MNFTIKCRYYAGFSNAKLEIKEEGFGKFHGNISLDIPKDNPRLTRGGYAGIRSKVIILYFSSVAYNLNYTLFF